MVEDSDLGERRRAFALAGSVESCWNEPIMTPMKVMTIVGTRPEVIKLCRVIRTLDAHVRHVLIHTGQNHDYELNQVFFEQLEVRKPDHFLNVVADNLGETLGNILARAYDVMVLERPDALLLPGGYE